MYLNEFISLHMGFLILTLKLLNKWSVCIVVFSFIYSDDVQIMVLQDRKLFKNQLFGFDIKLFNWVMKQHKFWMLHFFVNISHILFISSFHYRKIFLYFLTTQILFNGAENNSNNYWEIHKKNWKILKIVLKKKYKIFKGKSLYCLIVYFDLQRL